MKKRDTNETQMGSLRSKLFVGIGAVLLVMAALNYFLPEMLVKKDLTKAGHYLKERFDNINRQVQNAIAFLVTERMVESAAGLEQVIDMVDVDESAPKGDMQKRTIWSLASDLASYNPQISFVQVQTDAEETVLVSPETAQLYTPAWSQFIKGMLWIKIPGKTQTFVALPLSKVHNEQNENFYLLFDQTSLQKAISSSEFFFQDHEMDDLLQMAVQNMGRAASSPFISFPTVSRAVSKDNSAEQMYLSMTYDLGIWKEKLKMIQLLSRYIAKDKILHVGGALKITDDFKKGCCILSDEVFFTHPIVASPAPLNQSQRLSLFLRPFASTFDLDVVRFITIPDAKNWEIALGFSIVSVLKKIAEMTHSPLLIYDSNGIFVGLMPDGATFDPHAEKIPLVFSNSVQFRGAAYVPFEIDLNLFKITILTPESEVKALTGFLTTLRDQIQTKISLILMGAALLSLLIALALLANISKKITQPIAILARASEDLGKGNYEQIVLPELKHRTDEVAVFTHSFKNMVGALRDRDKIRGVLNKVVSKEISEEILKHNVELGGEERSLTMLFSDIRGFTRLSESLSPKEVISMLNRYMTRMCHHIDQTHGVVDKFVGDEIMALFGAPLPMQDHAVRAIDTALRMIDDLKLWNEERRKKGEVVFEIGIGIHTGNVCCGNMGAEDRLNYTVIGANVNLAARLCSSASGMQTLISKQTFEFPGVKEQFICDELKPLMLKGIDHPVELYTVRGRINQSP